MDEYLWNQAKQVTAMLITFTIVTAAVGFEAARQLGPVVWVLMVVGVIAGAGLTASNRLGYVGLAMVTFVIVVFFTQMQGNVALATGYSAYCLATYCGAAFVIAADTRMYV